MLHMEFSVTLFEVKAECSVEGLLFTPPPFGKDFEVACHPPGDCAEHLTSCDRLSQRQMNGVVQSQGYRETIYKGCWYRTVLITLIFLCQKESLRKNDLQAHLCCKHFTTHLTPLSSVCQWHSKSNSNLLCSGGEKAAGTDPVSISSN